MKDLPHNNGRRAGTFISRTEARCRLWKKKIGGINKGAGAVRRPRSGWFLRLVRHAEPGLDGQRSDPQREHCLIGSVLHGAVGGLRHVLCFVLYCKSVLLNGTNC